MFGKENLEEPEEPPEVLSDDEETPIVVRKFLRKFL